MHGNCKSRGIRGSAGGNQDFGFQGIENPGFGVPGGGSCPDLGFQPMDLGFQHKDFGFQSPDSGFHPTDMGFQSTDFGFHWNRTGSST